MCGLTGIFDLRGERPIDRARLQRMTDMLFHRGPDAEGLFQSAGLGLGHRRLAIRDITGGKQPMFNETGEIVIVFNGEIYDFEPLAAELEAKGHRFRSKCDTEAILHGWEEWGAGILDRLNGMFAFAIWDARRQCLFLARDRLGEKPLYYTADRSGFVLFASELSAILAGLGEVPSLDPEAVEEYFAFGYVPDPKTIHHGIFKLSPGECITLRRDGSGVRPVRYWNLPTEIEERSSDPAEELAARLEQAVKIRMAADVPLGAFLSGGVDSSAVVAGMARQSARPVDTFSIGFGDARFDESPHAAQVAGLWGTNHHAMRVEADAASNLDALAGAYTEPFADSSALPTLLVSRLARRHLTVALSGDGADEVLGGYRRHRFHQREEQVKAMLPWMLRRPLFGAAASLYPKLDWAPQMFRAKATLEALSLDAAGGLFRAMTLLPDALRLSLFSGDLKQSLHGYRAINVVRRHMDPMLQADPLARALYVETKLLLPSGMLVKVDRASMAASLEVRAPFLDHTLVEWAMRLPSRYKVAGGIGKRVLKRAMEPYLPHDILYRPKQGFSVPLDDWLRGPLAVHLRRALDDGALDATGLFDRAGIRRLADDHRSGRANHGRALWSLLMFHAALENARTLPVKARLLPALRAAG